MDLRPERMPEGLLRVTRWDDIGVSSRLKACGGALELDEPKLVHPNIVGAHRAVADFTGATPGH
jgi:hypothetical protein